MNRCFFVAATVVTLAACMTSQPRTATGCAAALKEGDRLRVNEEMALIVWEPKTKTEHFIRQAQFVTDATDFGFLVPTPTEPTLSETDGDIFWRLNSLTEADVQWRDEVTSIFRLFDKDSLTTDSAPSSRVQVLNQQTVAGYDAAVLKASDPVALTSWLKENDYATRPALQEWLQHYTENDWVITAFKFSEKANNGEDVVAQPIRLSFKTDVPFYPYREPTDMRDATAAASGSGRKLRVFFLSDQRYDATLGQSAISPAKVAWANSASSEHSSYGGNLVKAIATAAKLSDKELGLSPDSWITEFEDNSSPRNGIDELFFHPAKDQSTVERPVIIKTRKVKQHYPNLPGFMLWLGLIVIAIPLTMRLGNSLRR